ncbi:SH3 domain-containing protein [Leptospira harrisiae]|uniref:SH3 domain-containing protein n=1 Tax=Leptospira harrisiae TaxID=2023189 RepID=UPI000C2A253A|nr:SH3 domain-containing protein [Leptospira harrisiae]PKA06497.1 hypothetical protein CH366_18810 [Leptospira harrisiae]
MTKKVSLIFLYIIISAGMTLKSQELSINTNEKKYIKILIKPGSELKKKPNESSTAIKFLKYGEIGFVVKIYNKTSLSYNISGYWYQVNFNGDLGYVFSPFTLVSYNRELLEEMNFADTSFRTDVPVLNILPIFPENTLLSNNQIFKQDSESPLENIIKYNSKIIKINETYLLNSLFFPYQEYKDENIVFKNISQKLKFTSELNNLHIYSFSKDANLLLGATEQCYNCDGIALTYLFYLSKFKILKIPIWDSDAGDKCNSTDDEPVTNLIKISADKKIIYIIHSRFDCERIEEENCDLYQTCENYPPIFFEAKHRKTYYFKLLNNTDEPILDGNILRGSEKEMNNKLFLSNQENVIFKDISN